MVNTLTRSTNKEKVVRIVFTRFRMRPPSLAGLTGPDQLIKSKNEPKGPVINNRKGGGGYKTVLGRGRQVKFYPYKKRGGGGYFSYA